jgi:hypothetical protein
MNVSFQSFINLFSFLSELEADPYHNRAVSMMVEHG